LIDRVHPCRCLLVAPLLLVCGCSFFTGEQQYRRQVEWGYVMRKGDASRITRWTLQQEEPDKIVHGMASLLAVTHLRGLGEPEAASKGYVHVYRKLLTGWPSGSDGAGVGDKSKLAQYAVGAAESNAREHPDNLSAQGLWKMLSADWARQVE
jgi:hypothetical protein